ncbi:hypothetical protein [Sandaracinus amylolyticus]|uniref:hypothetical protein n=1 Tax=Sandaracinus amylolyticus TaxID=927083 RepID=UPI001F3A02E9|nr:hypothetical protein [Sandaracinus amylolyticus]UJR82743.1 Hypothetical protein I5071_48080 [Sandaracinus amylolyticus]
MDIPQEIQQRARQMARAQLARSTSFAAMSVDEQRDIYLHVVQQNADKLAREQGLSVAFADKGPGAEMGFGGYDPGFQGSTAAFNELVDSVDFPKFVADLLKAVFDANLRVMKSQTDDFIRLMREATKSTADFVKKVGDDEAFAYLAETKGNQFNLQMEPGGKLSLTNPQGEKVDLEDNEVKARIMDAKIAMAKEHRAALREVLLMGVTRLVVEKGEIEAGVEFKITANRNSKKTHNDQNINTVTANASYSFLGFDANVGVQNTNIQINTSEKTATDDLSAKLMGKVKIAFKTDYFKLDNFANMYADGGVAALKPPAPGGQGGGPAKP